MRLRLQRVHFQLQSLKGKIKGFLSFNSLGEMIFWDVDSCQTAKPVKNYQTEIVFIFLKFSQCSTQLPFTSRSWNFYSVKRFFFLLRCLHLLLWAKNELRLLKLTIKNTVPFLLAISSVSVIIVISKGDAAAPDLQSRCHWEGSLHI